LLHEITIREMHFYALHAALDTAPRRDPEGLDNNVDLLLAHRDRYRTGNWAGHGGGRPRNAVDRWIDQPAVRKLLEHSHAVGLHRIHQLAIARDDAVIPGSQLRRVIAGVHRTVFDEGETHAALGPLQMVGNQIVVEFALPNIRAVRRADHAVLDSHVINFDRLVDELEIAHVCLTPEMPYVFIRLRLLLSARSEGRRLASSDAAKHEIVEQ